MRSSALRGRLAVAALGAVLAGCSGAGDEGAERSPPPPPPPEALDEVLEEVERTRPGVVLQDFVRAAARGDERRMWERLSTSTRRRLGPTLGRFRSGAAGGLERDLKALGRRHALILTQTITPKFAVAAVGRADRAYAAALRLEDGLWRVQLTGRFYLKALRPRPGERVGRRTQVAVEVAAPGAIVEAGLWLDGFALPSRGGAVNPIQLTMFTEASRLDPGPHTVVAFASTAGDASALAWTFRARG